MKNEQAQRRIIAAALFSTKSTTLLPSPQEQLLAEAYVQGTLTIDESVAFLNACNRQQAGLLTAHYPDPVGA